MSKYIGVFWGILGWAAIARAEEVKLANPLGADNLQTILLRAFAPGKLIAIIAPIVTLMVLWGAFLMITSSGEEEKISKGRKTILWAVVGFVLVLLATSIVPLIQDILK